MINMNQASKILYLHNKIVDLVRAIETASSYDEVLKSADSLQEARKALSDYLTLLMEKS